MPIPPNVLLEVRKRLPTYLGKQSHGRSFLKKNTNKKQ